MSQSFAWLGAAEIATLIRDRKASAYEVMQATLARAEKAQAALNCFITICADEALRDAKAADAAIARGVFGSPYIVINGEPFWGADRLDQVEKWLATGGW